MPPPQQSQRRRGLRGIHVRTSKGTSPYAKHTTRLDHITATKAAGVPTVQIRLSNPSPSTTSATATTRRSPLSSAAASSPVATVQKREEGWRGHWLGANQNGHANRVGGSPWPLPPQQRRRHPLGSPPPASAAAQPTQPSSAPKIKGANYTLPQIFRDPDFGAVLGLSDEEGGLDTGAVLMSDGELRAAWGDAAADEERSGGGVGGADVAEVPLVGASSSAPRRSALRALAELWPELPPPVFKAALGACRALPAGNKRIGDRHTRVRLRHFEWLATFLGHFMRHWYQCDCLDPKHDVPLTFAEFECACGNLRLLLGDQAQRASSFLQVPAPVRESHPHQTTCPRTPSPVTHTAPRRRPRGGGGGGGAHATTRRRGWRRISVCVHHISLLVHRLGLHL
jgi:hypothetical protein